MVVRLLLIIRLSTLVALVLLLTPRSRRISAFGPTPLWVRGGIPSLRAPFVAWTASTTVVLGLLGNPLASTVVGVLVLQACLSRELRLLMRDSSHSWREASGWTRLVSCFSLLLGRGMVRVGSISSCRSLLLLGESGKFLVKFSWSLQTLISFLDGDNLLLWRWARL
jgi:hypothetical protein